MEDESAAKLLPARPVPKDGEEFASWVMRVAVANGLPLGDLVRWVWTQYASSERHGEISSTWPNRHFINRDALNNDVFASCMALATGVAEETACACLLTSEDYLYSPLILTPALNARDTGASRTPQDSPAARAESYCPECLASDFYLRRPWRVACLPYCPAHRRPLMDFCPRCSAGLDFYGGGHPEMLRGGGRLPCHVCRCDLASVKGRTSLPGVPEFYRFVSLLIEGGLSFDPVTWNSEVITAVHRVTEALFGLRQQSGGEPVPAVPPSRSKAAPGRTAFVSEPAEARYDLFEAAFLLVEELRQEAPKLTPEQSACLALLAPSTRRKLFGVAQRFFPAFLADPNSQLLQPPPLKPSGIPLPPVGSREGA